MLRNTRYRFGPVAKLLHWLIAALMLSLIPTGWYMVGLSDEDIWYYRFLDLHQAMGLSVFALFVVKIIWMLISPNPKPLNSLPTWERRSARVVHTLLIALMAVIPTLGYLFAAGQGDPIDLYGIIEIPGVIELTKSEGELIIDLHAYFAYGCAVLIAIHILAALKHHFIDKNNALARMLFGTQKIAGAE